jgi:glycosyltransferase involved in cell wall biosynthesis
MTDRRRLFSILIPTYNRPQALAACLEACARLDFPRDQFEVLVVDDGSSQPLGPVVAAFQDRLAITLLIQSNSGPGLARNAGALRASGKYLAFTDDDCTPDPNWLRALAAYFESRPDGAVGGLVFNQLADDLCASATHVITEVICNFEGRAGSQSRFFTTNNLVVPTEAFLAAGGFFEYGYGEDREFCDRWVSQGRSLAYVPQAVVYHAHPMTLRYFLGKHAIYGRGAYRYHQARARRSRGWYRFEPFSSLLLLRYPLRQRWGWRGLQIGGLLVLSKIANALGFFYEAGRDLAARLRVSNRPTREGSQA